MRLVAWPAGPAAKTNKNTVFSSPTKLGSTEALEPRPYQVAALSPADATSSRCFYKGIFHAHADTVSRSSRL